jgi:hypothetical protein
VRQKLNELILVALHDAFGLYGRPQGWIWDPRDRASLMFGYPVGSQKEVSISAIIARRCRMIFLLVFVSQSRSRRDVGPKG